ncbi:MAG: rod-binding protein [Termitinemataceae bacterium]|nr:MAG: rod-binding protein [Termitinemataceae bacterium]
MGIADLGTLQIENSKSNFDPLRKISDKQKEAVAAVNGTPKNGTVFSDYLRETQIGAKSNITDNVNNSRYKISIKTEDDKKLWEQCEALETYLLKNLVNGMRKTVDKANLVPTGFAGEMYEDMLYDEYSKEFSKNAGFGFAAIAYLELKGERGKLMH